MDTEEVSSMLTPLFPMMAGLSERVSIVFVAAERQAGWKSASAAKVIVSPLLSVKIPFAGSSKDEQSTVKEFDRGIVTAVALHDCRASMLIEMRASGQPLGDDVKAVDYVILRRTP